MTDKLAPLTGAELQAMLDRSPFIAFLGLKVTEADPAREQVVAWLRSIFEPGEDVSEGGSE